MKEIKIFMKEGKELELIDVEEIENKSTHGFVLFIIKTKSKKTYTIIASNILYIEGEFIGRW